MNVSSKTDVIKLLESQILKIQTMRIGINGEALLISTKNALKLKFLKNPKALEFKKIFEGFRRS